MSSNINTYFIDSKIKLERDSCKICDKLFNYNALVVTEHILEHLKFLIEEIDTTTFENSLICEECYNQINEACDFKFVHREKETKLDIKGEEESDENRVLCYNCKNIISENSYGTLFDGTYLDMFRYFATKQELEALVNSRICETCHISISKLQPIMTLLSVYDTTNVHKIDDYGFMGSDTKLIAKVKEEKLDIPTEDMEIKIEQVILKSKSDKDCSEVGVCGQHKADRDLLINTEVEIFRCQQCEYRSMYKGALSRHMKSHNETITFRCEQCEYQTIYKDELSRHMKSHNKTKTFRCPKCAYQTIYKDELSRHMESHNKTKMFRCPTCEYQTNLKHNLKRHKLTHKKNKETKLFRCQQCNYQTRYKSSFTQHMLGHDIVCRTKMSTCHHCEYIKSYLKKHMLNHTHEVIICPQCKYQTNDK